METEFIYWRHSTPAGIKVEEICGADDKPAALWREMALQIYCENGRDGYREIGHYPCGAPFLEGSDQRISITHTRGLLAVATLPRTPEAELIRFSERTAMGIDAERADRSQVLKIRSRFLNDDELAAIAADGVEANVQAWTAKEALYKAALNPGVDFRTGIRILQLPCIEDAPAGPKSGKEGCFGKAVLTSPEGKEIAMTLYSYRSEGCVVTLAYSPRCAKGKAGSSGSV